MRFALTDEQEMLRASVRGALERSAPIARVREWLEAGDGSPATTLAAQQGWMGIGMPETAGGQGGGLVELTVVLEEHARAAVPGALLSHAGLALPALLAACGAEDPLVRELAEGKRIGTLAVDAGDLPRAPAVQATRSGGAWTLSGSVAHVLGAAEADTILVPGIDDEDLRMFVVERAEIALTPTPVADPGRDLATLELSSVPAVALGAANVDLAALGTRVAVLTAADSLGTAQRMLDMTVRYVREREQFGVPVGSFQAVKHTAAEMLVDIEASRSATYFGAWSVEHGEQDAPLHASVAKFVSGDGASRVAEGALSLHGAVGFTWEHDLHFFYKRAKVNLSLFGSPGRHRQLIGDALTSTGDRVAAAGGVRAGAASSAYS